MLLLAGLFAASCELADSISKNDDDKSAPAASGDTTEPAASESKETDFTTEVPSDFAGVVWLHHNVSGWPVTASLNASVSGGFVHLNYDKADVWPTVNVNGTAVNANPWIFVFQDGTWYAATFEWLRPGQTSKPTSTVAGDHIKKSPLNNFSPVSGEIYGFMVSGLARDDHRNVEERSNVDMVRWP